MEIKANGCKRLSKARSWTKRWGIPSPTASSRTCHPPHPGPSRGSPDHPRTAPRPGTKRLASQSLRLQGRAKAFKNDLQHLGLHHEGLVFLAQGQELRPCEAIELQPSSATKSA